MKPTLKDRDLSYFKLSSLKSHSFPKSEPIPFNLMDIFIGGFDLTCAILIINGLWEHIQH